MENKPEIENVELENNDQLSKPKRNVEISKEAENDRMLLSGLLIERAEDLRKDDLLRKKKIRDEIIEFHSGVKISLNEIHTLVTAQFQHCDPLFPNDIPFFSEMYRLLGWHDKNPNDYFKDSIVGRYINELIYRRFPKDVLLALRALAIPGGVRLHKFYHFLNPKAQNDVVTFRDQAISIMKKHNNWKDFRKEYGHKYNLPFYSEQELF